MGILFTKIRTCVAAERYLISEHAAERLNEREWQAVVGIDDGELLLERPDAMPNPAVEVKQAIEDGTEIKAVWSYLKNSDVAKRVTIHFFDR